MTFVFRTSSFFVVFVITVKAATFVVGNADAGSNAADRLNDRVERLIDESIRFRGEAREASDRVVELAAALHVLNDRAIECVGTVCAAIQNGWNVLRHAWRPASTEVNMSVLRTLVPHIEVLPKKEVKHGGYTAVGQCG